MAKEGGWFRALRVWLSDKIIEHWPTLLALAGGGAMTYLASASTWLDQYGPIAWGVVGVLTILVLVVLYLLWQVSSTIRIRNRFNSLALEKGSAVNPLVATFENQRILINDFVLPSHTLIENKTFIHCDLIGPANIYFLPNTQTYDTRLPRIDAVWMSPESGPASSNIFFFSGCVFRNCSFQRITIFVDIVRYPEYLNVPWFNWVSIPPTEEQATKRKQLYSAPLQKPVEPQEKVIEKDATK